LTGQSTAQSIPPRLARGTRPRKRWRYIAIFGEELMACAALVHIGPARQSFWALYDRHSGELRERTRLFPRRAEVALAPGRLRVRDRGIELDVELEEEAGIQARCPHGRGEVWTRKQAGIAARGTLRRDGGERVPIAVRAVIDDTLGYHARATEWRWSAGVGEGPDGTPLAWNLVEGVNDPPVGSERAVWVEGTPQEVPPVRFARDLSGLDCEDGSQLHFQAEVERSRHDNFVILRSDYRAPFGTFSGALPGGIELAEGLGVMEHHDARW
jgi:hypothetical protein